MLIYPLVAGTTIRPFLGNGGGGLLCTNWPQSGQVADLERHQQLYFADVNLFPLSSELY